MGRTFKGIFYIFLFSLFLFSGFFLFPEVSNNPPPDTQSKETAEEEEKTESLYENTLQMDIKSATYYELVSWCQRIGLSDTGDINALRKRLYDNYKITPSPEKPDVSGESKKISIKSSRSLKYYNLDEIDQKYIEFEGNVILEISEKGDQAEGKKGTTHQIEADKITYNQTENVLTATGHVRYTLKREGEEEPEVYLGESLTFNVKSWEGVFFKGVSKVTKDMSSTLIPTPTPGVGATQFFSPSASTKTTFYFTGETIARLENDTVIMDDGRITSSEDYNDPYWQIRASRIWVLATNEWAIWNATLYIGRVPILYLPFYFNPGDELFFNPVIGYKLREGNFLQTTVYLMGEKEKKQTGFSFMKATEENSEDYVSEIKGLFLRKVKKEGAGKPATPGYLKFMMDMYTNLGFFLGVDSNITSPSLTFKGKGGIAFSRNIYYENSVYTPYHDYQGTYADFWNTAPLWGIPLPFRYAMEANLTWPFMASSSLTGNLELFSDPSFPTDFYNRQESTDLTELFNNNQTTTTTITQSQKTALFWSATGYSNISTFMPHPYINNFSISKFSASIDFNSKQADFGVLPLEAPQRYSPTKNFYYPVRAELPNISMSISGELLSLPFKAQPAEAAQSRKDPGKGFIPPFEEKSKGMQPEQEKKENTPPVDKTELVIPPIKTDQPGALAPINRDTSFTLGYSFLPSLRIENQFNTTPWTTIDAIDFSLLYTQLENINKFDLNFNLKLFGDYVSVIDSVGFYGIYRTKFNRNSVITDVEWFGADKSYIVSDFKASRFDVSNNVSVTTRPFLDVLYFNNSTINYTLNWIFYEYKYLDQGIDPVYDPVYEPNLFPWVYPTNVKTHTASTNFYFTPDPDLTQSLQFVATLPPCPMKFEATFNSKLWYLKSYVNDYVIQDGNSWKIYPLVIRETLEIPDILYLYGDINYDYDYRTFLESKSSLKALKLFPATGKYLFEQDFNYLFYDPNPLIPVHEINMATTARSALNLWDFRIEYLELRLLPVEYNEGNHTWETKVDPYDLRPYSLTLTYTMPTSSFYFWENRIQFILDTLSSNLTYNLYKFTDSRFTFSFGFKFIIEKFTEVAFRVSSYNNYIYAYIPAWAEEVGQSWRNPLQDLVDAFNIFDSNALKNTAFKMQSLNIGIIHHLSDWDLMFNFEGKYAVFGNQRIWTPEFSILIQWIPIPEIKKEFTGDADGFEVWK